LTENQLEAKLHDQLEQCEQFECMVNSQGLWGSLTLGCSTCKNGKVRLIMVDNVRPWLRDAQHAHSGLENQPSAAVSVECNRFFGH